MANLTVLLQQSKHLFNQVINTNNKKLIALNLSVSNANLQQVNIADTNELEKYISGLLLKHDASIGVGGYNEHRALYNRSNLFDGASENRCIHLGVDVWCAANTAIYAPLQGVVHSAAYNNNFGDYGATIILQHQLIGKVFYTLYGHLSLQSIENVSNGMLIEKGQQFAWLGLASENGNWPPHLHFQIIENIENYIGDYPGVCTISQTQFYLQNCPNADLILDFNKLCI